MASRSMSRRQLSRSKLELFRECPRCFHDDLALGLPRPSGPAFTLNLAVDALLKDELDACRAAGEPHPLFASVGLEAVPFQHERLAEWRNNFAGVRWTDPRTGWTLYGAVDDVWVRPDGTLIVADYKATARKEEITPQRVHPAYRRQLEIYQFLIAQNGFRVASRGWLVYANGIKDAGAFHDVLRFRTRLIPVDGDRGWVAGAFREAVELLESKRRPAAGEGCAWCRYVDRPRPDAASGGEGVPA